MFRREILIAYHKHRFLAAIGRPKNGLVQAAARERDTLFALGYLHKHEYTFTNRFSPGPDVRSLHQQTSGAFDDRSIYTYSWTASNKIEVLAPLKDLSVWKDLVAEFAR